MKEKAFGVWILNKVTGFSKKIKTTYVGSWVTSTYSSSQGKRVYHATLVNYKKSNYTQPLSVQYYDVSQWYATK